MTSKNCISVNEDYFKEVSSIKNSGSDLARVRNGLEGPDSSLKVKNVKDADCLFDLYDKISKLIAQYGRMVEHDAGNFHQVGTNQQKTDRTYGDGGN